MSSVEDATRSEVDQLGVESTSPGLVEVALKLARQLDETDKPTSAAVVARELRGLMADLRRLAPVDEGEDTVNDITRQREKRRAAAREQAAGD